MKRPLEAEGQEGRGRVQAARNPPERMRVMVVSSKYLVCPTKISQKIPSTKGMGQLLLIALLVGALLGSGTALAVTVGRPAPDFTLPSTSGKDITLSEYRGKKIVLIEFYAVNFGAT